MRDIYGHQLVHDQKNLTIEEAARKKCSDNNALLFFQKIDETLQNKNNIEEAPLFNEKSKSDAFLQKETPYLVKEEEEDVHHYGRSFSST